MRHWLVRLSRRSTVGFVDYVQAAIAGGRSAMNFRQLVLAASQHMFPLEAILRLC
jgi:hypothetical protein